MPVYPSSQRVRASQCRDAFVSHGGEDGAADQDLPARVASAFGLARACEQARTLGSQPPEAIIDGLDACTCGRGLCHAPIVKCDFVRGPFSTLKRYGLRPVETS